MTRRRILFRIFILVLIAAVCVIDAGIGAAGEPIEQWNKTFGGVGLDGGRSIQQTSDGGYVITGYTTSYGAGYGDIWFVKTDATGNEIWNKTFGGADSDEGFSVQQTSDSGYIIAGHTKPCGAGATDLWLVKTDVTGNEIWNKTFGDAGVESGYSIQQTSDDGYVIAGYTTSYGAGDSDLWLVKTDAAGTEIWNKTFGGAAMDKGYSVQQTSDGGYIIAGFTWSYGAGLGEIWLVKTDASGTQMWNKIFGGTGYDIGYSVQQTSDGGYVITGSTTSFGAGDLWLVKTDATGKETWNKTFGGTNERGNSVQQTSDGGYVIAGHTSSYGAEGIDLWFVKTDAAGTETWNKTFGGAGFDTGYSVQQTSDGGYVITGRTSYGAEESDLWLIKVSDTEPLPDTKKDTKINATDIKTPDEKSIPGFGAFGVMIAVLLLFILRRGQM